MFLEDGGAQQGLLSGAARWRKILNRR